MPGETSSEEGQVLGKHSGIHHSTVGSERACGSLLLSLSMLSDRHVPLNRVVVGEKNALLRSEMMVSVRTGLPSMRSTNIVW